MGYKYLSSIEGKLLITKKPHYTSNLLLSFPFQQGYLFSRPMVFSQHRIGTYELMCFSLFVFWFDHELPTACGRNLHHRKVAPRAARRLHQVKEKIAGVVEIQDVHIYTVMDLITAHHNVHLHHLHVSSSPVSPFTNYIPGIYTPYPPTRKKFSCKPHFLSCFPF